MRRSTQVLLVLMGGGLVAASVVPALLQPDCDPAQQVNGACPSSSSRSTSFMGWGSSGSDTGTGRTVVAGAAAGAAAGAIAGATSRGGFGATGAARSSGG